MFEVVLKQDYEDIFFFRDFEVNGLTNNSPPRDQMLRGESPDQKSQEGRNSSMSKSRNATP